MRLDLHLKRSVFMAARIFASPPATVFAWLLLGLSSVQTHARAVPDTFTATTTAMTPSEVTLRIEVLEWPDADARKDVLSALSSATDIQESLSDFSTLGYVWPSNSSVGYSVKYAHRTTINGNQRVTFVTDKAVGSYGNKAWQAADTDGNSQPEYSVIELYLDGDGIGTGTMSVAAAVKIDAEDGIVTLTETETTSHVLKNAKQEPQPYWEK